MNPFTILHISDLHRTREHVTNHGLISSMEAVLNSFVREGKKPQILVVSGDIVQGSKKETEEEVREELIKQYQEATDFLVELAELYLNGDRSKVILIPGNHDVSFFHSKKSMQIYATKHGASHNEILDHKRMLRAQMHQYGSRIRWNWREFDFFRIVNEDIYKARLEAFCAFFDSFYGGTLNYSLNPEEQYTIYDYPELGATVVGFSSCHENDHCNFKGSIHIEAISKVERDLRKAQFKDRMKIAVWHHHTSGNPDKYDYMDNRTLQHLIRADFHLGMHGHAHETGIAYEPYRLQKNRQMVIISAGSLCAGDEELPSGELRSFNLIHVNQQKKEVTVDIFRDSKAGFSGSPIWTRYREEKMQLDINVEAVELQSEVSGNQQREMAILPEVFISIESLIAEKSYRKALEFLATLDNSKLVVRRLLLECYQGIQDHEAILQTFGNPQDETELRALLIAAEQHGDRKTIASILSLQQCKESNDQFVREMSRKLERWMLL